MAIDSETVSMQARQETVTAVTPEEAVEAVEALAVAVAVEPVQLVARRLAALGWFLSHAIAVATLTALGAVVALAAVMLFCLAAPLAGVAFVSAMRRRDLRQHGAALT
jgi:hypothetical protein